MKDPVECFWNGIEWIAYRDPEGFIGSGKESADAYDDLDRQEKEWKDEQHDKQKWGCR